MLFKKNSVMSKKEKNLWNKHVRVKKSDNLCLVAHTALKVLDTCLWYLDSACSKHMIGDRAHLKIFKWPEEEELLLEMEAKPK
jgi:hypothetical protein